MEQEKIARINALAHKAKAEGLTPEEIAERDALRKEYIADVKRNLVGQPENTTIVRPDGPRQKVQKKKKYRATKGALHRFSCSAPYIM